MSLTIHCMVESKRGCGWRKPAKGGVGVYLMGGKLSAPCGRLPVPLLRCPTCDSGIKPSRSWTWIEPAGLFAVARAKPCLDDAGKPVPSCPLCPLGDALPLGRHGLIWIGEKFYTSPHDFVKEAAALGVSRKVPALPRGFELGKTWVYLAHRAAVQKVVDGEPVVQAGVFTAFLPTRIDLVVDTDDPEQLPERARKLAEELGEGCRLVKVTRDVDTQLSLDDAPVPVPPAEHVDYEIVDPDTTDPKLQDAIARLDAKVAANPSPQFVPASQRRAERQERLPAPATEPDEPFDVEDGVEDVGENQDYVPDESDEEWEP